MTDTEKDALERRIDELCAEVERLREQTHNVNGYAMPPYSEYERLYDENAKLRKLVSDMGKMLTLASWASVENDEQASQCIYSAEALGIEVPS